MVDRKYFRLIGPVIFIMTIKLPLSCKNSQRQHKMNKHSYGKKIKQLYLCKQGIDSSLLIPTIKDYLEVQILLVLKIWNYPAMGF